MRYVTIKDIAEQLGISTSTVSRALADDRYVSEETRRKVLATAAELGYHRNENAAHLRLRKSRIIGIVVPEMVTPFFQKVIVSVQERLNQEGFKLIITQSHESYEAERYNLRLLEDYRVEGIIMSICDIEKNRNEYLQLEEKGIPLVFFDRVPPHIDAPKVMIDDYRKAFFLMEHLIGTGRRKIIHLAGPTRIPNAIERKRAYVDVLNKFKLPVDPACIIEAGSAIEEGEQSIVDFLKQKIDFDAVFCFTDTLAFGAMKALAANGFRIPEDIAVTGFSGTILSTIVNPSLTTVVQPVEEMGKIAAELMMERITAPGNTDFKHISLNAEIKIGKSS